MEWRNVDPWNNGVGVQFHSANIPVLREGIDGSERAQQKSAGGRRAL
jgi:hypothetical protein